LAVGSAVGSAVAVSVGVADGVADGRADGVADGDGDGDGDGVGVGSDVGSDVAVMHAATSLAPAVLVTAEVVVVVQSRVTVADESYALPNFSLWAIQLLTM